MHEFISSKTVDPPEVRLKRYLSVLQYYIDNPDKSYRQAAFETNIGVGQSSRFIIKNISNIIDIPKNLSVIDTLRIIRDGGYIKATDDQILNRISNSFFIANTPFSEIETKLFEDKYRFDPNTSNRYIYHVNKLFLTSYTITTSDYGSSIKYPNAFSKSDKYKTYKTTIKMSKSNNNKKALRDFIDYDLDSSLRKRFPKSIAVLPDGAFEIEKEYLYQNIAKFSSYFGYWKGSI